MRKLFILIIGLIGLFGGSYYMGQVSILIIGLIGGLLYMFLDNKPSTMLIISIVILIYGFFIALKIQNPDASSPVFWFGFFIFLISRQQANRENPLWQSAIMGLLAHVLIFLILVFFGDVRFIGYLKYFYSPITYFAHSFPPPQHIHTDIKLILEATYNFLNVFIFILIGAILGKFFIEQKSSQPIN